MRFLFFDFKVLQFMREKDINLFITPPDTIVVTQLLDQSPNWALHCEYSKKKSELFSSFHTINHEGFTTMLGAVLGTWATKDSISNTAKRVGITKNGPNMNHMQ